MAFKQIFHDLGLGVDIHLFTVSQLFDINFVKYPTGCDVDPLMRNCLGDQKFTDTGLVENIVGTLL